MPPAHGPSDAAGPCATGLYASVTLTLQDRRFVNLVLRPGQPLSGRPGARSFATAMPLLRPAPGASSPSACAACRRRLVSSCVPTRASFGQAFLAEFECKRIIYTVGAPLIASVRQRIAEIPEREWQPRGYRKGASWRVSCSSPSPPPSAAPDGDSPSALGGYPRLWPTSSKHSSQSGSRGRPPDPPPVRNRTHSLSDPAQQPRNGAPKNTCSAHLAALARRPRLAAKQRQQRQPQSVTAGTG